MVDHAGKCLKPSRFAVTAERVGFEIPGSSRLPASIVKMLVRPRLSFPSRRPLLTVHAFASYDASASIADSSLGHSFASTVAWSWFGLNQSRQSVAALIGRRW